MPDRPRCSNCNRRVSRRGYSTVPVDGERVAYCTHKPACRRARREEHGRPLRFSGASDEALGTALDAADYVNWPWWAWLLPRPWREELRVRFARVLAAAVEHRTRQAEAVDADA